jgi:ABC-type hemin transport system ATPase subunit
LTLATPSHSFALRDFKISKKQQEATARAYLQDARAVASSFVGLTVVRLCQMPLNSIDRNKQQCAQMMKHYASRNSPSKFRELKNDCQHIFCKAHMIALYRHTNRLIMTPTRE